MPGAGILNRLARGPPLPSHLITVAGANHGSSLAQVGRTAIARVFRWIMQDGRAVGERVLADLDYGSTFLWAVNTEWLDAWNTKGLPAQVYCFSYGGDKLGASPLSNIPEFPEVPGWQFLEPGSDSIVRVSGANLNYSLLTADAGAGALTPPQSITPPGAQLVSQNEFTYVDVAIPRDVDHAYAIVPFSVRPDPNKKWPPVPQI